jgi:Na+/melibiose symporter-like transporter
VIGLIIANTAAAHFFNVGFIPFMTEVIPVENRASVFAARNIISSATLSVCGFLFGIWLERIIFPTNYTLMFVFGFICSMVSLIYLFKIKVPVLPEPEVEPAPIPARSLKGQLQLFSQAVSRYPGFARFTLNTLFHGIGLWLAVPLYVLYFVRELGATEGWLGINGTVAMTATIIGMLFWRWRIRHWGESPVLKGSIILAGVYPIMVGLLHELPYILVATGLNSLITSAITLTHFNTMIKVIPGDKRPVYTAAYITVANLGAFICPLIGVELANRFGFEPVLIACGLLSIVGSMSFWVWPVQSPPD